MHPIEAYYGTYNSNKRERMEKKLFELVEEYQSESKPENKHKYNFLYTAKRTYFYKIFELFVENIDQLRLWEEILKRGAQRREKEEAEKKETFTPTLGNVYWWSMGFGMGSGGKCLAKATPMLIAQGGCLREATEEEKELLNN
jgi:hypothetical protein